MRGGFVACIGGKSGAIDRAVGNLRWHHGNPVHHQFHGLEIAALVDATEGPLVESHGGVVVLVHGGAIQPLADLQRAGTRFAALEWDGTVLRASRDPLGLAPLFYRIIGQAVWLATEVEPLVSLAHTTPDLEALCARAAFVPIDDRTGWCDIFRVVPGAMLEIALPKLLARSSRYWFPERMFSAYRGSYQDALDEFRVRFDAAVRRCHAPRSAILLSGGLDSAAVAASARCVAAGRPHLVHVHYSDLPVTHEQDYAAAVANLVGAPLHTVPGYLKPWDIGAELDMHRIPYNWLPYGMDEPALASVAAAGIDVALDGHDGDGVLGSPGRGIWGSLVTQGEWSLLWKAYRRYGARRTFRGIAADFVPPLLRPASHFPPTYMQAVAPYFRGQLGAQMKIDDIHQWRSPASLWRARQIQPLLPRAVISFEQKEIEAASFGVDLRHPFADRELVAFLISLPPAIKSDPGRAKPVLVDAMSHELPASIHARRKSDYMAAVARRVSPGQCVEVIKESGVRFTQLDYALLFGDCENDPEGMPLTLLVNLARVHEFARRAAWTGPSGKEGPS